MSLAFTLELLTAINANEELKSRLNYIGDMPPDNAVSPYLVIGTEQDTEGRLLSKDETKHYITLHTWSDYNGRKEIKELNALLTEVFDGMDDMNLSDEQVFMDSSEWWHGVLEYYTYLRR